MLHDIHKTLSTSYKDKSRLASFGESSKSDDIVNILQKSDSKC